MKNASFIPFFSILVIGLFFVYAVSAYPIYESHIAEKNNLRSDDPVIEGRIGAIIEYIRANLCTMSVDEMIQDGLEEEKIREAKEFCKKTDHEMYLFLTQEKVDSSQLKFYSCGDNSGIPNYSDFGLTSSSCTWHDPNPALCKVQGGVACLWGCNNPDPKLGWHIKSFASKAALESEIFAKGYHKVSDNYFGGAYRRSLPNGYSYQVHAQSVDSSGKGTWHSEGPEPSTEPSWEAILGGWYPTEAEQWHNTC